MMENTNTHRPIAVISGGTGYIGSAIVEALTTAGWEAVALSRSASEGSYVCDVTDEKAVRAAIATIAARGTIRACIHAAAAPLERLPVHTISAGSFDSAMDTSVRAAFLLAKEAIPLMPKDSAFIGITTQAIEPGAVQPSGAYLPAKYALRGFLRALSAETKNTGVRVYAVAPGFLPGGLNRDLPQQMQDFFASKSGTNAESAQELGALVQKLCIGGAAFPAGSSVAYPSLAVSPL